MPPQPNLTNIVRIDIDKPRQQHCWEVKIVRTRGSFHRSFSDSVYGGKDAAREAAMRCRDAELKKHPAMTGYDQAMRPKKNNKSGIVGVRFGQRVVRRGSKSWTYPAWIATGTPISGEKPKIKYFTLSTHDNSSRKAKEAAISQRRAWERSLKASIEAKERKA